MAPRVQDLAAVTDERASPRPHMLGIAASLELLVESLSVDEATCLALVDEWQRLLAGCDAVVFAHLKQVPKDLQAAQSSAAAVLKNVATNKGDADLEAVRKATEVVQKYKKVVAENAAAQQRGIHESVTVSIPPRRGCALQDLDSCVHAGGCGACVT